MANDILATERDDPVWEQARCSMVTCRNVVTFPDTGLNADVRVASGMPKVYFPRKGQTTENGIIPRTPMALSRHFPIWAGRGANCIW